MNFQWKYLAESAELCFIIDGDERRIAANDIANKEQQVRDQLQSWLSDHASSNEQQQVLQILHCFTRH